MGLRTSGLDVGDGARTTITSLLDVTDEQQNKISGRANLIVDHFQTPYRNDLEHKNMFRRVEYDFNRINSTNRPHSIEYTKTKTLYNGHLDLTYGKGTGIKNKILPATDAKFDRIIEGLQKFGVIEVAQNHENHPSRWLDCESVEPLPPVIR